MRLSPILHRARLPARVLGRLGAVVGRAAGDLPAVMKVIMSPAFEEIAVSAKLVPCAHKAGSLP